MLNILHPFLEYINNILHIYCYQLHNKSLDVNHINEIPYKLITILPIYYILIYVKDFIELLNLILYK
jgi:hypothetical protein